MVNYASTKNGYENTNKLTMINNKKLTIKFVFSLKQIKTILDARLIHITNNATAPRQHPTDKLQRDTLNTVKECLNLMLRVIDSQCGTI